MWNVLMRRLTQSEKRTLTIHANKKGVLKMTKGRWLAMVGMLACLALLAGTNYAIGASCGLSLPCESDATSSSNLFTIWNDGAGSAISGVTLSDDANQAGVYGSSTHAAAGVTGGAMNGIGVFGYTNGSADGVRGKSSGGVGVYGLGFIGPGVKGVSSDNNGVVGECSNENSSGVFANNLGGGWGLYASNGSDTHPAAQANNSGTSQGLFAYSKGGKAILADGGTNGVHGKTSSASAAILGDNSGGGVGVKGTSRKGIGGYFQTLDAFSTAAAVRGATNGKGQGGLFEVKNATNNDAALKATTDGTGWAGKFVGTGANTSRGVLIETNGGTGLQVSGGTKSAVVPTSKGNRALYAEEASEVYFTDYGFGKLQSGKVVIPVDPLFAETVNLREDYHVFVQSYGEADLYVTNCTPTSFEVRLRAQDAQGDGNVKFSYRLVGKRKGFEMARLDLAPLADNDTGQQREKPEEKVAALTTAR
jgi:hypothetical protein